MSAEAEPSSSELPIWRRALSFVVGAALIAYVLSRLNLRAFARAIASTHYVAFALFIIVFQVALLSSDSFATTHVYRKYVCPVHYRDVLLIRGASYLPSMLNHHIGQGWLTYFVSKVFKAPLWRVAGATLMVYATTLGGVFVLGACALPLNHGRVPWLALVIGIIAAAGFVYLVVVHLKPGFLERRQATALLVEAGVRGHLLELAYRMLHISVLFLGTWIPFRFFHVDIPLSDAFAYIPAVMLVAALPITPQGVGTRDVVALELLSRFAPGHRGAAVVAATLSYACALTLVQALFSPLLMRRARRLLARPALPSVPPATTTESA